MGESGAWSVASAVPGTVKSHRSLTLERFPRDSDAAMLHAWLSRDENSDRIWVRESDANVSSWNHLYPLSLNSYVASPIFFSETIPRGHEPRTACKIAGVAFNGGYITRKTVAETKDMAKGTLPSGLTLV